jgi:hypothetical protein
MVREGLRAENVNLKEVSVDRENGNSKGGEMRRIHKVWGWAVLCLVLASAPAAVWGQTFQCTANAAVPPTVGSEGLAELVGDLILICTGGGASGTGNFQVFLNTSVTSNILGGDTTEALLLIDEPSPGSQSLGINVFQGIRISGNSIAWTNVPIVPPGGGFRTYRFSNIRVDATLPTPTPGTPATVLSLLSGSGSVLIPINNPTQVVAFVQPGINFSVTPAYFKRWLAPGISGNPTEFSMTFAENFPTAFRKGVEVNAGGSPIFQNTPGLLYQTESGFTSAATGAAGIADSGTRLVARFNHVPNGVSISVPTQVQSSNSTLVARLYSGVNSDFSGGSEVPGPGMTPVTLAEGAGFAVWEVTGSAGVTGALINDHFTIPVTVSYFPNVGSGIPGLGMATVSRNLAPISAINTMSQAAPEPRFIDAAVNQGAFTIRSINTFQDVPDSHFAANHIEILAAAGITAGCTAGPPPEYCPESSITRGQMAVFIEGALGHPPNTCTSRFDDVSADDPFCGFIERMADDGITSGCGGNNFCPNDPVTRGQMAVFIEAALGNPANSCTGQFLDVALDNPFCGFIERLAGDGITGGCGGGNFCPDNPVTRGQMAVFLVAAPPPLNP